MRSFLIFILMIFSISLFADFSISGSLKYESEKNIREYNISLSLDHSIKSNRMFHRINVNNDNSFDSISYLNRLSLDSWFGKYFSPFLVFEDSLFLNYHGEVANRFLYGLGFYNFFRQKNHWSLAGDMNGDFI